MKARQPEGCRAFCVSVCSQALLRIDVDAPAQAAID
jgi:hypothetical protein